MDRKELYRQSLDYFFAPLLPVLEKEDDVTEILINGANQVYFESNNSLQLSKVRFPDEMWLASMAQNIAEYVGRNLDSANHSLAGRLPKDCCIGDARVHVVAPPASRDGFSISIRRFRDKRFTMKQLVSKLALTEEAAQLLQLAVLMKCNIAVSGGTGTGKTTLLNALASAIPDSERILVIEETSEINLDQPHTVHFETQQGDIRNRGQVTIRDLFVDSLRMRPDRIIVGEVRQGEALDMVQSMLSGHAGALTTVHASTPRDALTRLETLCMMTEEAIPHHVAKIQVGSAMHLVVQIERYKNQRRVRSISECCGLDPQNEYRLRPLYRTVYDHGAKESVQATLKRTSQRPRFAREALGYASASDFPALDWLFHANDNVAVRRRTTQKFKKREKSVASRLTNGNSIDRGGANPR